MTMKMEPSSRKNSSVMEIPSLVNKAEDVVTQKMDILMILNPLEVKAKTEEPADNDSKDSKMDVDTQREPSHYIEQPRPITSGLSTLIQYQAQLGSLESHTRARLNAARRSRTQLPPAPINRRPLAFTPINASHRYTNQYSLPPIYSPHDKEYHSSPPVHRRRHDHHHNVNHRHHSQSVSAPNRKRARSNKAYSIEEVDFIRYHKEDLNKTWDEILSFFKRYFVDRDTEQSLSSRYYRDNCFKMYDADGRPMQDENGKIRTFSAKVRQRGTPAGREEALPYTLVQKHPERAMRYPWVSEQHKVEAQRLAAEMTDLEREIFNSQRVLQLRNDEIASGIAQGRQESANESMDESSNYEGSSTASSPQITPRSSP
ncbi:ccdda093-ef53-4298-9a89-ad62c5b8fb59 [Sclerotinia trifoliorum]|uniref:Ccdda093-ef53-4298-9a89-ad62c5b8fb59 n=1 Tax=Sclerotinia trifoliorum TaxID=28548 RepID=A0A8H2VU95_9HELO|nr:ccdda093-ef53-4298-9a89-ad62c5b8fb59 [Sclerotinia trifoliorum]